MREIERSRRLDQYRDNEPGQRGCLTSISLRHLASSGDSGREGSRGMVTKLAGAPGMLACSWKAGGSEIADCPIKSGLHPSFGASRGEIGACFGKNTTSIAA